MNLFQPSSRSTKTGDALSKVGDDVELPLRGLRIRLGRLVRAWCKDSVVDDCSRAVPAVCGASQPGARCL